MDPVGRRPRVAHEIAPVLRAVNRAELLGHDLVYADIPPVPTVISTAAGPRAAANCVVPWIGDPDANGGMTFDDLLVLLGHWRWG